MQFARCVQNPESSCAAQFSGVIDLSIPKPPVGGTPPSLLGSGSAKTTSSGKSADDLRMLSGLGPNPGAGTSAGATPWRFGLILGGVLGAAAIAMAFWWQSDAFDTTQSVAAAPKAPSSSTAPTPEVARATVAEPPAAPVPASAAAKIEVVNEARPASAVVVAAAPETAAASSVAAPLPASAASKNPEPAARPAAVAQRPTKPNTASRTAASSEQRPTVAASSTKPGAGKDSDVDLLAAIVSHLQGEIAKQATDKSAVATPAKTSSPRTIAQLVRGCKKLAGKEETACIRKICDGYWGKAQACPANAAPREGRVKEAVAPGAVSKS